MNALKKVGAGQGGAFHHGKTYIEAFTDLPVDTEYQVPRSGATNK
jgi:hypothetical protein